MPTAYELFGVAGVHPDERPSAYRTETILQWLMVGIAFWLLIQRYLLQMHYISQETGSAMRWVIWAFFVFETTIVASLCRRRWYFILSNWLNLAIIVLAFPLLWQHGTQLGMLRIIRIIIILYLLLPIGRRSDKTLSAHRFGIILLMFTISTLLAGLFLAYIDPDIGTPWDGIWWAFQTVTTVGYGDVLPKTPGGRIFSILFMLVGVGLLATLSASFAYFLLKRKGLDKAQAKEQEISDQIAEMKQSIEALRNELKKK